MEIDRPDRLASIATLSRAMEAQQQVTPLGRPTTTMDMIVAQKCAVPRDLEDVKFRLKQYADMAGAEYYYSFPVKKKNRETGEWETDAIEGPTIKLANDLVREYGNCAVETMVTDVGDSWIIYARFVDLERGFTMVRPFQQRKAQASVGTKDVARQQDIALQIGVSKAIRNVVVNSLESYATYMFEEAKSGLLNWINKEPEKYRTRILNKFADLKVNLQRVERQIGRPAKDWKTRDLARLFGELKAVNDGMITVAELYPDDKFLGPREEETPEDRGDVDAGTAERTVSEIRSDAGRTETRRTSKDEQAPARSSGAGERKAEASATVRMDGRATAGSENDARLSGKRADEPEPQHSERLMHAMSELQKMHDSEQVDVLLSMAADLFPEDEFELFSKAADERKATLTAKQTSGNQKSRR